MNGIAKQINRILMDLVKPMLKSAKLPQKFWAEAIVTAVYIQDRIGHKLIKRGVPLVIWTDRTSRTRRTDAWLMQVYQDKGESSTIKQLNVFSSNICRKPKTIVSGVRKNRT